MKPTHILNAILLLAVAGLAVWGFAERNDRLRLRARAATLEAELAQRANSVPPSLRTERTVGTPESPPTADGVAGEDGATPKKKKDENPMAAFTKGLSEMMDNPAMKDMMATQVRGGIESGYKDLFDDLELSEEQRKTLVDLLAERTLTQQLQGMKLFKEGTTKADLAKMGEELKAAKLVSNEKIKETLGDPSMLDRYQRYEDSQPERQQIGMLKGVLTTAGEPLSTEQEEKLMAAMYSERKAYKFDHNYQDETDVAPEKFTGPAISRYQEQSKELDARIATQAAGFLSETQIESFRTTRGQMHAMEKMGLDMVNKMFTGAEEAGKEK